MTHTINPYSHRLGVIRDWKSKWTFSPKNYAKYLKTDTFVREYLNKELRGKYISSIDIARNGDDNYNINIKTTRTGMIIGKTGDGVEKLISGIKKTLKKAKIHIPKEIKINIEDVHSAESDAAIVAYSVVEGLERKMPFRRVLKTAIEKSMANKNVKGIKILVSGRLGGSDMARKESIKKGRIPLQTFRADIDYKAERANLPYGVIGVKVWIYRGEIFNNKNKK